MYEWGWIARVRYCERFRGLVKEEGNVARPDSTRYNDLVFSRVAFLEVNKLQVVWIDVDIRALDVYETEYGFNKLSREREKAQRVVRVCSHSALARRREG